jgi:hypothetical protein
VYTVFHANPRKTRAEDNEMKVSSPFAPLLLMAFSITPALSTAQQLPVGNPNFSNVAVQCGAGYAYQASSGETCTSQSFPAQALNGVRGMDWVFGPHIVGGPGVGLTVAGTSFNPPSFSGLPFSSAAFLQGLDCEISQTIFGFVAGGSYRLSFYLGSRYDSYGGYESVAAYIDSSLVGAWSQVGSTPFTLRSVPFRVSAGGAHILKFVGTTPGGQTAFLSGVSIEAIAADEE